MAISKIAAIAAGVGLCAFSAAGEAGVLIEQLAPAMMGSSNQITGIVGDTGRTGETRIFTTRKQGVITVYDRATGSYSPFQDLTSRVVSDAGELGLLGLAFDPGYATNGFYYAYLTARGATGGTQAQVIRFTDPLIASASEQTIWTMELGASTNHIGGWIDFDATGKLLIAIGDGGVSATPDIQNTGQNANDGFGAILRIDPHVDGFPADAGRNYAIPADNPTLGTPAPAAPGDAYLYGVRNPYRNTVTPDGFLIVADVGHNDREELTIVGPGDANRNLGWPIMEGEMATPGVIGVLPADYQGPDLTYDHSEGVAILGGFVYRGSAVPELAGRYVFGDVGSGSLWSIAYENGQFSGTKTLIGTIPWLVAFGELPDGELIATQFQFGPGGAIYRLTSDGVLPAVPEPATWASLIAGFALAGGVLRRRERTQPRLRGS